jgi:hypothetical protein
MDRVVLILWPCLRRAVTLLILWFVSVFLFYWFISDIEHLSSWFLRTLILCLSIFVLALIWRWRVFFRLYFQTSHFVTISTPQTFLYYDPVLQDKWNFSVLLARCDSILAELRQQFGLSLPVPLVVIFFATRSRIREIFRRRIVGIALLRANAIVIADDTDVEKFMRHELAHLFAAKWNLQAPRLLVEGLATFLQGDWNGRPLDFAALSLLRNGTRRFPLSFKYPFTFPKKHSAELYILAGSFTAFLISRFGWDAYRRLYRSAHTFNLGRKFRRILGISLSEAESQWRRELFLNHGEQKNS